MSLIRSMDMFRAICKFAQIRNCVPISKLSSDLKIATLFRNCAAQFRNCVTSMHAHFQNCARACHLRRQCDQKQLFDRFCVEQFKDRDDKTSKTITISREKRQQIVNVIKKDPSAVTYSSQLKMCCVSKPKFS